MPYTSLLGLSLPTTGTLAGTWGDEVNNAITSLLDSAVAGTTTLSTDADVTLTSTDGVANQARAAVILWTAGGSVTRNITAPARSKAYVVINATSGSQSIVIRGTGPTTGVTVLAGRKVLVAWNGTDFVAVAGGQISLTTDVTGTLPIANGGTNSTATATAGGVGYGTGTAHAYTAAGTSGQALVSAGASAPAFGTLGVAGGGTGATTLTANNVLLGNGTSALQVVAPGTSGNVLTSNGTTWTSAAVAVGSVVRSARTSNTILAAADKGTLIDITSGTFTQTFTAAATLGSGWWCYIRNSGTGDITLDPNASETIDGLTSYIMYPNEVRLVQCDGTSFYTIVLQGFYKAFTATGTFTTPPKYSSFSGIAWGAGASGSRSGSVALSQGGGGGGSFPFTIAASLFSTSQTITIGAGGAAFTGTGGTTFNAGGDTSIGSLLTVPGAVGRTGSGFGSAVINPAGFEGQIVTNATTSIAIYGGSGSPANTNGNSSGSRFGGGAGGSCDAASTAYNGGTSTFGGSGGNAVIAANGVDGTAPGGGGGATQTGTQSGAGARGEVRIWGVV